MYNSLFFFKYVYKVGKMFLVVKVTMLEIDIKYSVTL